MKGIIGGFKLKKKVRNWIATCIFFVLTIGIVLGAGLYRTSVAAERAQFQAKIPSKDNALIVLDLAKQGWPKKIVQPGFVQISTGHGPMGIQNVGDKALFVQVSLKGFPGDVELDMPDVDYDADSLTIKGPLQPQQLFKMDLAVEVPKDYRDKLIGFSGEIQFLNQKDKSLLSSIPVHIVNSEYGDPYKKLNIERNLGMGSWSGKGNGKDKYGGDKNKNETGKNNEKKDKDCH